MKRLGIFVGSILGRCWNRTVEVYRGKKSCKEKLVENSSVASI